MGHIFDIFFDIFTHYFNHLSPSQGYFYELGTLSVSSRIQTHAALVLARRGNHSATKELALMVRMGSRPTLSVTMLNFDSDGVDSCKHLDYFNVLNLSYQGRGSSATVSRRQMEEEEEAEIDQEDEDSDILKALKEMLYSLSQVIGGS